MKPIYCFVALSFFVAGCGAVRPQDATPVNASDQFEASIAGDSSSAPDFSLKDTDGNEVSLSDFRGKTVVLEWFNPGCPFVKYAHGKGPLATMAKEATQAGDVVWLAINSGASGKQGTGLDVNQAAKRNWAMTHAVLLDESGETGQKYAAKTTPHMYVIDKNGDIRYRGALDNAPLGRNAGAYRNYVSEALADLAGGSKVRVAQTLSYGCSVKY